MWPESSRGRNEPIGALNKVFIVLSDDLFLPSGSGTEDQPACYEDMSGFKSATIYRPEAYPVAEYLLEVTGRSRLADIGCRVGRKLAEARAQ